MDGDDRSEESLARRVAFLDFEAAVLRAGAAEPTLEACSSAAQAVEEQKISVHPVDYRMAVLLRIVNEHIKISIDLARALHTALGRELAAIDAGFQSSVYQDRYAPTGD